MRSIHRKTILTSLILACILFAAGSGEAVALERSFGDGLDGGLVLDLFQQVGDFLGDLISDLVEIIEKSGTEVIADG